MTVGQRVFSGVQPTGALHLGNYLGALRNFAALQQTHSCLYCVVDLHAITLRQEPKALAAAIRQTAAAFLACGIDPVRQIVFAQSQVSVHAELAWILNCTARIGWLERMTQFKEKAGKSRENASVGLYAYPILMAADILAYRATHVPVGADQTQHLELARDIAGKFNADYACEVFPLPEAIILPEAARVMSLRDGRRKMSKSEPSDMSRILLTDDADRIAHKIRRARTDSDTLPGEAGALAGRPEAANLLGILGALSGESGPDVLRRWGGRRFAALKEELTERLVAELRPVGCGIRRALADPAQLDRLLAAGAARARALAEPVLRQVKEIVGLAG